MIITSLMGGLGNQMFQYAAARHLSLLRGTELRIDSSRFARLTANREHSFQLTGFNISASHATGDDIRRVLKPRGLFSRIRLLLGASPLKLPSDALFREPEGSVFKPDVLKLTDNRYIIGYFNSYKYFDRIRETITAEYTPREKISSQGVELLKLIESKDSVSIHIRRGDYVNDPSVYQCIEGIITDRFYRNAIELICSKVKFPHFFVFSNDIPWVRGNFRIPFPTTLVDFNSAERGLEDLWLMSRCRHNITAGGSTFSWWGAYLNQNPERIVVRTEQVSNDSLYDHPDDYFPMEWLAVDS